MKRLRYVELTLVFFMMICMLGISVRVQAEECQHSYWVSDKDYLSVPALGQGTVTYICSKCGASCQKTVSWQRGTLYSKDYDIFHADVYAGDKIIKVSAPTIKGAVIKVTVGKKTYTRKATATKTKATYTIKIKKAKAGQQIIAREYYKGKVIGQDLLESHNYVFYSDHLKKGMASKYVPYTWFGQPARVVKKSGGITIWYDGYGSWVRFKHGKVVSWRD